MSAFVMFDYCFTRSVHSYNVQSPEMEFVEVPYGTISLVLVLDGLLGITFRFLRREVSTDVFAFLQNSILEQA
jgi:hypothetical protein